MNERGKRVVLSAVCCSVLLVALQVLALAEEAPGTMSIRAVEIEGNHFVEESTIRYYIHTRPGDLFSVEGLRKDLNRLYALNFFTDIRVDTEEFEGELIVTFVVSEKPSISVIRIVGNDKVKTSEIQDRITVEVNSILNEQLVRDNVLSIKDLYEENGYFFTDIDTIITDLGQNQAGLELRIKEGRKVQVRRIEFLGNKFFSESTLEKVMETKEGTFFKKIITFGSAGTYKRNALRDDTVRLQLFYRSMGFKDVQIGEPEIELDPRTDSVNITIPIEEGEQFKVEGVRFIGDLEIEGSTLFTASGLKGVLKVREGEIFDEAQLRQDILNLNELYSARGYAFAGIFPDTEAKPQERQMLLTYNIDKGPVVHVGRINITGNTRTRDKVIRREIKLAEGELYNGSRVEQSKRRLTNLMFFSDVRVGTDRVAGKDILDINVNVTEQQTGSISGGGGYSSVDGPLIMGSIVQRNFRGKGQRLALYAQLGGKRTDATLDFVEPYLFDRDLMFGSTLFSQDREFDTYEQKTQGGIVRFGTHISQDVTASIGYRLESTKLKDVTLYYSDVFPDVELFEDFVTSSVLPFISHDTRDNYADPGSGFRNTIQFEIAGLGGDSDFFKVIGNSRFYWTVPETVLPVRRRVVLMLHGQMGWVEDFGDFPLPISERLYLGGPRTVRGFEFRRLGPLDEVGNPIGGVSSVMFSMELQFPLFKMVKGVVFFDGGNVFASDLDNTRILENGKLVTSGKNFDITDLRYGAGVGLRMNTPMGPLALDIGWNLDPFPFEKGSVVHFDVGRR